MDRWSQFSNQIDQAIAPQASAAGRPGMGAGNVPHAPGLMSGRPGASPDAHQLYGRLHAEQMARRQPSAPAQGPYGSPPPGGPPRAET